MDIGARPRVRVWVGAFPSPPGLRPRSLLQSLPASVSGSRPGGGVGSGEPTDLPFSGVQSRSLQSPRGGSTVGPGTCPLRPRLQAPQSQGRPGTRPTSLKAGPWPWEAEDTPHGLQAHGGLKGLGWARGPRPLPPLCAWPCEEARSVPESLLPAGHICRYWEVRGQGRPSPCTRIFDPMTGSEASMAPASAHIWGLF